MHPFHYSLIESNLENPHIIKNKLYHIQPGEIKQKWNGKRVYLATHETKKLNFLQRIMCLYIAVASAMVFKKIACKVWFNKALAGKDTIAIAINSSDNSKNSSTDKLDLMIKNRQMNDLFEQGCRYRDGTEEGAPNLPLAKKWFGSAVKNNHPSAPTEWKKVTTSLVLNGYLEKRSKKGSQSALLNLAAYYKGEGKKDEAQKWKNFYRDRNFKFFHPKFAKWGGTLLVTSENTPKCYYKSMLFNPKLQETLNKHISDFFSHLQSKGILPAEEKFEPQDVNDGICAGIVMDFLSRVNAIPVNEDFETHLIKIAGKYECQSKVKSIALHSVYSQAHEMISEVEEDSSHKNKELTKKEKQILSKSKKIRSVLYQKLKQKMVSLPHLGIIGSQNDKNYLTKWLKEPDGNYEFVTQTPSGGHVLALIKQKGVIYLWDPNIGLVKCLGDPKYPIRNKFFELIGFSPIHKISKFLYLVYGKLSNHYIEINRVEPMTCLS